MKTTAFLIFYAGVLITLDSGALASEGGKNSKANTVKEEVPPPRPNLPLLTLPSFSSFSLSGLNFPYLQAFSQPNRISSPERVRATKIEYVEVTRRQTVHPVCYTMYEAKAPCLPYAQADIYEDGYDDFEVQHQAHDSYNLNEVKSIQPTPALLATTTINEREGKYLEFKWRRDGSETSSKIEGSEFFPSIIRVPPPPPQQATEYHTKTVLITKLEKYTDRRVTATLVALNCLPVDRSIPMCQKYPNPIREAPDRRSDNVEVTSDLRPSSSENLESDDEANYNAEFGYNGNETKPVGAFEDDVSDESSDEE